MYSNMNIGRERRLAYARQISPLLRQRELYQAIILDSYELLLELKDVEIGLISPKLIQNSTIRNSKGVSYCTICQDDIFIEIVRELKCKHSYHINCIDKWFTTCNNCPDCRFILKN